MKISSNDEEDYDDFWSLAMNHNAMNHNWLAGRVVGSEDDFDVTSSESKLLTVSIPAPAPDLSSLVLRLGRNYNEGCLSDVSGDLWDASLLLATYLFGTDFGRELCHSACFGGESFLDKGILEIGSGLGLCGMAAAAAANVFRATDVEDKSIGRVVLTDLDDNNILRLLKKNVESNLGELENGNLSITVEPCDWNHVANNLKGNADVQLCCPRGRFNLIIGSALVYVPEHAAACAETISHYLSRNRFEESKSQAIIIQVPDRAGFDAFLRRCCELNLSVSSQVVAEDIILSVENTMLGQQRLLSASDYRMYFITRNGLP